MHALFPTARILILAVVGLLVSSCSSEPSATLKMGSDIEASELLERIGAENAPLILDVRGPDEFSAGHLPSALNISHTEFLENADSAITLLPEQRDTEIVIHCVSGKRAGMATEVLTAAGYTNVRQLLGDYNGWQAADYPIVRAE